MTTDDELLGVGAVADLTGTTVRTLQYYDRIGLLVARRLPTGRRGYDQALLERLHHIRLMSELGLSLDRIGVLLEAGRDFASWQVYVEQAARLEMAELRLRCQRAVAVGLAEVLRRHPEATVPAEAMRALINFEDTLLAYRDLEPATPVANLDEQTVAQVIEIYLRWKAVAIQALVLNRHGIDPASDSGKLLGARWQDYLDFATATGSAGDLAERSQSGFESWPDADRDLHDATRDYLHACHRHHISEGTK